jgi:hypothetical protein
MRVYMVGTIQIDEGDEYGDWWLEGDVPTENVVAVYDAKSAANLAGSYVNLANPGTHNAAPGVVPSWVQDVGWIGDGSAYLVTDIVPVHGSWSIVAQFIDAPTSAYEEAVGTVASGPDRFFVIVPRGNIYGIGSNVLDLSGNVTDGVMAVGGYECYLNGVSVGTVSAAGTAINDVIYLLAARASLQFSGKLQRVAIYDTVLTDAQQLAIFQRIGIVQVETETLAVTIRAEVIDEVWSGNGFPLDGVDSAITLMIDPLSSSAANLDSMEEFEIEMDDNAGTPVQTATCVLWKPNVGANGKCVIFQLGHTTSFEIAGQGDMIRALVNQGYAVCGVPTPTMSGGLHDHYPAPTGTLTYLKFFFEPIVRCVNHLENDYDRFYMMGLSGGGWATAMIPAVDERIRRGVAIAGSLPLYMMPGDRDWEQQLPGIRDLTVPVDYQDYYVMCCTDSRRHLQILNTDDTCCFNEDDYNASIHQYDPQVERIATSIGGSYELMWDSTHADHIISAWAREITLDFFEAV